MKRENLPVRDIYLLGHVYGIGKVTVDIAVEKRSRGEEAKGDIRESMGH